MPGAGSVIRVQLLTEVHRAGTNTPSTRTPLDPLEFIPSVTPSPQSSRTVPWSRGMTSTIVTGPALPVAGRDQRVAHEVGGMGDTGAVVPGTTDQVAAVGRFGRAHGCRAGRAPELTGRPEDVTLAVLREVGGD